MRKAGITTCLATLAALALVCLPQTSDACAVCFSASDENREAFAITTAFLTGLPLIMIGSLVFWLRQRLRRHERSTDLRTR